MPLSFLYEPFIVGKGKRSRWKSLLRSRHIKHKITKLLREGHLQETLVIKLYHTPNESQALLYEKQLISSIGRRDLGFGPLLNLTDGGEGTSGRVASESLKEKLRQAHKDGRIPKQTGRPHTEQSKMQMREANKNRMMPKQTTKHIENVVNAISKYWTIITPSDTKIIIRNLKEFCRTHNLNAGHMCSVAKGTLHQHKGYVCSKL